MYPRKTADCCDRRRAALRSVVVAVLALLGALPASTAFAHKTIINALRLDVRPREQSVAAIFRLNTIPMTSWLRAQRGDDAAGLGGLDAHRDAFAEYLLSNVSLRHEGGSCESPGRLFVLSFDARRQSVLATTEFRCGEVLPSRLTFVSTLFAREEIAQDLIIRVENQGRRGTFILNSKGRSRVDFDLERLVDIGGKLKALYDDERTEAAFAGDLGAPLVHPEGADQDGAEQAEGVVGLSPFELTRRYAVEGFVHIWTGADHLLFVLCLVLAIRSLRQLVWILTAFTLGHSVSLALGAFDVFRVSANVIEPLVAATILLVAIENLVRRDPSGQRPWVALAFGVVHGFAFSQTLWNLEILESIVAPLVGFNVGVELGQLSLVLPIFPLLAFVRAQRPDTFAPAYRYGNALMGCAASFWLVERILSPS